MSKGGSGLGLVALAAVGAIFLAPTVQSWLSGVAPTATGIGTALGTGLSSAAGGFINGVASGTFAFFNGGAPNTNGALDTGVTSFENWLVSMVDPLNPAYVAQLNQISPGGGTFAAGPGSGATGSW